MQRVRYVTGEYFQPLHQVTALISLPWLTGSFFQLDARIHPLTAPLPIHLFNKTTKGMCNAEQVSSITRKYIPSQRPTTGYVHV
jgi:hypothetical protein